MLDGELERLYEQRLVTNTHITTLISLVDKLQGESTQITRRINLIQSNRRRYSTSENILSNLTERIPEPRTPESRNPRERSSEPRERNDPDNSDLVFYFYLPREESRVLTPEIIFRETTTILFSEIENPNNLACPISLESFRQEQYVTMINECCHLFNSVHLATWFESKTTCPVCRHDLIHGSPTNILPTNLANTPTVNRFANAATRILGNAFTSSMNDILNDLHI
uniref:RING-type domain-containing protein n=1 Tax=viral metagenome TaxID=1070528 RepID=A0A6C0HRL1_9ZZZZ